MKQPDRTILFNPELLQAAAKLAPTGTLALSANHLLYLNIDDNFIHQLFPLLQMDSLDLPNYFGEHSAGAHISVIYPEEISKMPAWDATVVHQFAIRELVAATIGKKVYYVLLVNAPSLLSLRRLAGLPDQLCFRGYAIDFHITIGVRPPSV